MKIPKGTWVLAMDGSKMLLLRNRGDTRKPILESILQEEADNPRAGLQGSDRPGRTFSSASPRRSSLTETDWHDEAKKDFTRDALGHVEQQYRDQRGDVIVLAAPSVLGDIRKICPEPLKSAIIAEIDKDVVNHAPEDIAAIIDAIGG